MGCVRDYAMLFMSLVLALHARAHSRRFKQPVAISTGTLDFQLFGHQFHITEVITLIVLALAVVFTAVFFQDPKTIHGSVVSTAVLCFATLSLVYLWKFDLLRSLGKLAREFAQLADAAEQEAKELTASNEKAAKVLDTMREETKELDDNMLKLKSQAGLIDATQEELDRIEGEMEDMICAAERVAAVERALNEQNARYLLNVKQDDLDQKRHRALGAVMEAFVDVDTRDNDGVLRGREIENMKRLLRRLPAFRETFVDPSTGEKKTRQVFHVDWKRVDRDHDGAISKWEFRTAMDALLKEFFSLENPKFVEEAKEMLKGFDIGPWWKDRKVTHSESIGNWWEKAP